MILMQTGTRSYSYAKSELDLQMESQTLLAQINTMIMESNSVHYDDANNILTLYQIEKKYVPATGSAMTSPDPTYVETKTVKEMKFIKFDKSKHELYLYEHNHDQLKPASGGSIACSPACALYSSDALFSEYIDQFRVTVDNNDVTIHLGMKSGKVKYDVDATTKVRNQLITYP